MQGAPLEAKFSEELQMLLDKKCPNFGEHTKSPKELLDNLEEHFATDEAQHRDGEVKQYFVYALVNPILLILFGFFNPESTFSTKFKAFCLSIFYIGKGTSNRPYQHLKEALQHLFGEGYDNVSAIFFSFNFLVVYYHQISLIK